MQVFKTLSEFKRAHKAAGLYFFDKKTMEFFNSKIESGLIDGKYFITSEQFIGSTFTEPRKYSVRMIDARNLQMTTLATLATKIQAKMYISEHKRGWHLSNQ